MAASGDALRVSSVAKAYGATLALNRASLAVRAGEVHALLGENGAGKSTLVKIIYGVLHADEGEMLWDGKPVRVADPKAARALGIGMVFQHFSLFEAMTVLENVALGVDSVTDMKALATRVREVSHAYGLPLDPEREVHTLSVGERQRIEIVRCLLQSPRLLIMDEPTSVLTPQEVEKLFETLRRLAQEGCAILYISHKLGEIRSLCHHCTVLRGGRVVGEVDPREETNASLARLMTGAETPALSSRDGTPGAEVLAVQQLQLAQRTQDAQVAMHALQTGSRLAGARRTAKQDLLVGRSHQFGVRADGDESPRRIGNRSRSRGDGASQSRHQPPTSRLSGSRAAAESPSSRRTLATLLNETPRSVAACGDSGCACTTVRNKSSDSSNSTSAP